MPASGGPPAAARGVDPGRHRHLRLWAWLWGLGALSACAPTALQAPPRSPAYARPPFARALPPPSYPTGTEPLAALPGWAEEDHAAALRAFQAGCGAATAPDLRDACARARSIGPAGETTARRFFEGSFRALPLVGSGLLTGYFSPVYPARREADAAFSAAVRAPPPDLVLSSPGQGDPGGRRAVMQVGDDGARWPYPDRAGIELTEPTDALAWMRPEDLFFLQIQGSGVLVFPDGARMQASYAADNGRPFVPLAGAMTRAGLLAPGEGSATNIRTWLREHAGPQAQSAMDLDPRYVFFRLQPDADREPAGAAGLPLPPGRAIAVDPAYHGYGELYWIDAEAPILHGAASRYRRLVLALDTGSAIRGNVRADLYLGRGDEAGLEAGRVRHDLTLVRLVPVPQDTPPSPDAVRETPPSP